MPRIYFCFDTSVGFTRMLMTLVGVWPGLQGKMRYLFLLPTSWMFFFNFLPQTTLAIAARTDFNVVLEIMCTAQMVVGLSIFKLIVIRRNHKDLKKLVDCVMDDWETASEIEQRIMWKNARKSRFLAIIGLLTMFVACVSLAVRNVSSYVYHRSNLSPNETLPKPVYLSSRFFFNTDNSPVHELIFVGQFMAAMCVTCSFSSLDGFFVFSILHLSGELHNLQIYLENLVDEKVKRRCTMQDLLVPIISRHQRVYRYIELIEKNFNIIFLFQIMATSIVLCLQGYQVVFLSGGPINVVVHIIFIGTYMATSLVSIFIYCFSAEQLRVESEGLFHAAYRMKWYELQPSESKLLLLFMARTQTPMEITVGKLGSFSLNYFCSILRSTGGYLSMLLAMKDRF